MKKETEPKRNDMQTKEIGIVENMSESVEALYILFTSIQKPLSPKRGIVPIMGINLEEEPIPLLLMENLYHLFHLYEA